MAPQRSSSSSTEDEEHAKALQEAYSYYLFMTEHMRVPNPQLPVLELIEESDLDVEITRDGEGNITHLHVRRVSDFEAINFIGSIADSDCVVFRGEKRFLDRFINFTTATMGPGKAPFTTKMPPEIRISLEALGADLSFDEFRVRVEVVECVVWNKGERDDEGTVQSRKLRAAMVPNANDEEAEMAVDSGFVPSGASNDYANDGASDTSSKEDQDEHLFSEIFHGSPQADDGGAEPAFLSRFTEESSSDSDLSDPPDEIVTPPWMKEG